MSHKNVEAVRAMIDAGDEVFAGIVQRAAHTGAGPWWRSVRGKW
jgi:hypothetical protein